MSRPNGKLMEEQFDMQDIMKVMNKGYYEEEEEGDYDMDESSA